MRRALARARDGKALDETESLVLLGARGADLAPLFEVSARVRDAAMVAAGRPGVVTYSRKVFIPLTRLCRDRCHYCTFVTVPHHLPAAYLSPDEVLDIARAGAAQGCKEALFTLGDRPEDRWPEAREWLDAHGYDDTLAYVRAMAIRVLEETGLLPHLNPGVLSWSDLQRLKPVAPSMGMMLETMSRRLFEEPGQAHFGSPDKNPAVRLRVLEDAGRVGVPFTTGILVGIGENVQERLESILTIRRVAREYGSIQECIVQNFRAKDDTAMRSTPDLGEEEYLATIAVTRLLLGPSVSVQAPPNLSEPGQISRLLAAGVDDWGGVSPVTPDHINPERPWPEIDDLRRWTAESGLTLAERLTTGARYVLGALQRDEPWIDPRLHPHVRALADPQTGLANPSAQPQGLPWQEPDGGMMLSGNGIGRVDLHHAVDHEGRTADRRSDFDEVYGSWAEVATRAPDSLSTAPRLDADVRAALGRAQDDPAGLTDQDYLALLTCDGADLEAVTSLADDVRRDVVGDDVTYVGQPQHQLHQHLLRRLPLLRVRPAQDRRRRLHTLPRAGRAARRRGPGSGRHRGLPARRHRPGTGADGIRGHRAFGEVSRARHPRACVLPYGDSDRLGQVRHLGSGLARGAQGRRARLDPGHGGRDPRRRDQVGAHQGQTACRAMGRDRRNGP